MQPLIQPSACGGWVVDLPLRFPLRGALYSGRVAKGHPEATIVEPTSLGITVAVVHWSAGWGEPMDVLRYLAREGDASYHFVIGRTGSIWQAASIWDATFHAGDGRLPEHADLAALAGFPGVVAENFDPLPRRLNNRSIGICLCNRGPLPGALAVKARSRGHGVFAARHRNPGSRSRAWESYPELQVDALDRLLAHLAMDPALRFVLRFVTGHEDVTHAHTLRHPGAKLDPGPALPWASLTRAWQAKLARVRFDFGRRGWEVCSG